MEQKVEYGTKEELRIQALSKIIKNTFKYCSYCLLAGRHVRISANKDACRACQESVVGAH